MYGAPRTPDHQPPIIAYGIPRTTKLEKWAEIIASGYADAHKEQQILGDFNSAELGMVSPEPLVSPEPPRLSARSGRVSPDACRTHRADDTDARMMSHATTERSSSHQSTSGTGGGARSEGLLIKPTVSLLAAPSSVANHFLACFGGHQSNGRFLYRAGCLTTSSQKTHSDGFLYSSVG